MKFSSQYPFKTGMQDVARRYVHYDLGTYLMRHLSEHSGSFTVSLTEELAPLYPWDPEAWLLRGVLECNLVPTITMSLPTFVPDPQLPKMRGWLRASIVANIGLVVFVAFVVLSKLI